MKSRPAPVPAATISPRRYVSLRMASTASTMDNDNTALLERFHTTGDDDALGLLLERHRGWLWSYVRRHMWGAHRAFETSEDVVQDVLMRLLRQGPKFIPENEDTFRRLVATIVLNRLHDRYEWARAERRDKGREAGADALAITRLSPAADSIDSPSQVAGRNEEENLVRLALELIDPDDALAIESRQFQGLEFEAVGERLGVSGDTARKRFNRAVQNLGTMVKNLRNGHYDRLAPDLGAGSRTEDPAS